MNVEEKLVVQSTPSNPAPERKKFLRLVQVKETTGLSRTTIYRKIAARKFPRQIHLGSRAVAWVESDVIQWMNECEQLSRDSERAG